MQIKWPISAIDVKIYFSRLRSIFAIFYFANKQSPLFCFAHPWIPPNTQVEFSTTFSLSSPQEPKTPANKYPTGTKTIKKEINNHVASILSNIKDINKTGSSFFMEVPLTSEKSLTLNQFKGANYQENFIYHKILLYNNNSNNGFYAAIFAPCYFNYKNKTTEDNVAQNTHLIGGGLSFAYKHNPYSKSSNNSNAQKAKSFNFIDIFWLRNSSQNRLSIKNQTNISIFDNKDFRIFLTSILKFEYILHSFSPEAIIALLKQNTALKKKNINQDSLANLITPEQQEIEIKELSDTDKNMKAQILTISSGIFIQFKNNESAFNFSVSRTKIEESWNTSYNISISLDL